MIDLPVQSSELNGIGARIKINAITFNRYSGQVAQISFCLIFWLIEILPINNRFPKKILNLFLEVPVA
jgi:hypothetical protein